MNGYVLSKSKITVSPADFSYKEEGANVHDGVGFSDGKAHPGQEEDEQEDWVSTSSSSHPPTHPLFSILLLTHSSSFKPSRSPLSSTHPPTHPSTSLGGPPRRMPGRQVPSRHPPQRLRPQEHERRYATHLPTHPPILPTHPLSCVLQHLVQTVFFLSTHPPKQTTRSSCSRS